MMAGIQKEVKVIFNVFFKKTFPMPKEPLLLFQVQNRHISALCKIWSVGVFFDILPNSCHSREGKSDSLVVFFQENLYHRPGLSVFSNQIAVICSSFILKNKFI